MAVKLFFDKPTERAVYLVHALEQSLEKYENQVNRKSGFRTRQIGMLTAIKSLPDPVTPTNIAEWLNRETNSITLMIDRMEKQDLLRRVWDLSDRRSLRVVLTKKGEEKFAHGNKSQKTMCKKVLSCLSTKELAEFNRLAEKILDKTFELRKIETKELKVKNQ